MSFVGRFIFDGGQLDIKNDKKMYVRSQKIAVGLGMSVRIDFHAVSDVRNARVESEVIFFCK